MAEREGDHGRRPAGAGDRRLGRLGEGVCLHRRRRGSASPPPRILTRSPLRTRPLATRPAMSTASPSSALEGAQVHRGVVDAEGVLEAAQLGDALHQGQLATLEPHGDGVAGALALGAPAGGLAALAGDAAPDPPAGAGGPCRWAELMDLHGQPFSSCSAGVTSTRWGTRASIPRISGRSGSTLVRPMPRRPRARRVPRCLGLVPMADRTWVTRSQPVVDVRRRAGGSVCHLSSPP